MEKDVPKIIKGPCCVCKETRELRDICIREQSEEACQDKIDTHIKCMASFGFGNDKQKKLKK